jgi:hypothetical protein
MSPVDILVAVSVPVPALYVSPASLFGARSPVADSHNATNELVSDVSPTVIVAGTILAVPSKLVPPIVRAACNAVAVEAFPVSGPENAVAVNVPVPALYVSPPSVFGARSPVADSKMPINEVVSVVSATVIVVGTGAVPPSCE